MLDGEYICPCCGKKYIRLYSEGWVYKYKLKYKIMYLCSWSCMLKTEEKYKSSKRSSKIKEA